MVTYKGIYSDCTPLPRWHQWDLTRAFLIALETGRTLDAQLVDDIDRWRREQKVPSIFTFAHSPGSRW